MTFHSLLIPVGRGIALGVTNFGGLFIDYERGHYLVIQVGRVRLEV